MKVTVKIKLEPTKEQIRLIKATTKEYIRLVNQIVADFVESDAILKYTSKTVVLNFPAQLKIKLSKMQRVFLRNTKRMFAPTLNENRKTGKKSKSQSLKSL